MRTSGSWSHNSELHIDPRDLGELAHLNIDEATILKIRAEKWVVIAG
jgi:hypothetical protein